MSEQIETEQPKTLAQLQAELQAWLDKHHLQPVISARGLRTGNLSPIADFMPVTHDAVVSFQQVQP